MIAATSPKILIVEDERAIAEVLTDNLRAEGFDVVHAADGRRGEEAWRSADPDLVVLDVMLPHLDGIALCRRMRELGDQTPVLFLSAKGQVGDRIAGLEAGGDDYLPKPFHLPEFLLRVHAILRRRGWQPDPSAVYRFAGHEVDFRSWTVHLVTGDEAPLGEREIGILRLLTERAGEVVSRDDILDEVWGEEAFPSSRTVDNFVVKLRRLFEPDPSRPVHVHTVWGVGYRFTPEPTETPDEASPPTEESP